MGKLEAQNKQNIRRTRLQEAIFTYLVSGGRKSSDLLSSVLEYFTGIDLTPPPRLGEYVKSTANRLHKRGFLKVEDGHYVMSDRGLKIWQQWQREDFKIKRPKKWDKKWRIIIFDIPEKRKSTREKIREILNQAGFQRIQDSVWIYPYDCEDVIGLLKIDYGIGKYLLYIIADQVENDKYLRMDFGLTGFD